MEKFDIRIEDLAQRDVHEILSYITHELLDPQAADQHANAIVDAIWSLQEMPFRIGLVSDRHLALKGIRGHRVKHYTIYFVVDEQTQIVHILRVLHMRQDWPNML